MDIGFILKIAGIGILIAVCALILQKSGKDEQALLLTVGGFVTVMLMLLGKIGELIENVRSIFGI